MKEDRGEVARLQEELRGKQTRLKELNAARNDAIAPPLLRRLQQEKQRCERYNRYFALLTVASRGISAEDMLKRIISSVRASDIVGIEGGDGRYHHLHRLPNALEQIHAVGDPRFKGRIAMILPEADRKDAESAVRRLRSLVTAEEQVVFRIAIYPEDSNIVEELLAIAAG